MSSPSGEPPPQYWLPLVGYLYWRMQSGDSPEQALERAKIRPAFPRLSDSEWEEIQGIARRDVAATDLSHALDLSASTSTVYRAYGYSASQGATVGVRVMATVRLTSGVEREVSVLVNAADYYTLEDVISQATDWIAANARAIWGGGYDVELVYEPVIAQLSTMKWDSAPIVL